MIWFDGEKPSSGNSGKGYGQLLGVAGLDTCHFEAMYTAV